jgi:hypothetical protein
MRCPRMPCCAFTIRIGIRHNAQPHFL